MSHSAIARRRIAQNRLARVSATAAKRRAASERGIRATFDSAQTTEENSRHWANADSLGPNAALAPDVRRKLRERARYEVANNTYAKGMIDTLATDTIGTGPALQLHSGNPKADTAVEALFWKWMMATKAPSKLLSARKAKAQDGEWFASFFTNPKLPTPVKLDFQPHESEMVSGSVIGLANDPGDGVNVDEYNNVESYRLLKDHPGDGFSFALFDNEADEVPARNMIHFFRADRPDQLRGIPEITPALPLFAQLRRYTLAVIAAAETAANASGILKSTMNPGDESDDDPEPFDAFRLERNTFLTMPKNWDLTQLKAEQPTTVYGDFKRNIIAEIARCLSMPYNVAAGDSSSFNYSSARLDWRNYARSIRVERSLIEADILDRLFAEWWREASLIPDYLPVELIDLYEPPEHEWRWDGEEYIDPQKEANAQSTRLSSLMTTHKSEFAAQGKDWVVEFQQKADELETAKALGLPLELLGLKPAAGPLTDDDLDEEDDDDTGEFDNQSTPATRKHSRDGSRVPKGAAAR